MSGQTPEPTSSAAFRWLVGACVAVVVAATVGAHLADPTLAGWLDDVHWTAAECAAAVLAWDAWRRRCGTPDAPAFAWFAAGMGAFLAGQLVWDAEDAVGWLPFPAPSDLFYLLMGPMMVLGLRSMARRTLAPADWRTVRLDAASVTVACVTATMAVMMPARGNFTLFQMLVLGLYPLGLSAAPSLGFVLLLTRRDRMGVDSLLMGVSTAVLALCWILWNIGFLDGTLHTGGWLNLAFSYATLGVGFGIHRFAIRPRTDERWDSVCEGVLRVLPLFLVVVAASGILAANLPGVDGRVGTVASFGGGLVVVLASIRQSLLLGERRRLMAAERLLRQREAELESRVEQRTRELALATQAAQTANVAKSQFLANMSHEIRTPLNSVIGLAHVALMECGDDERQRGWLGKIQLSGSHLLRLIDDILDMSRIEAGMVALEHVAFDMPSVVRSVRAAVEHPAHAKGIGLAFLVSPAARRRLLGDPFRVGQVLINLVANAVKFTERGEVVVEIRCVEDTPAGCVVRGDVRDTGLGIPPDALARIFSPFHQADNSTTRRFGGTGLGLAICGELVHLMGGDIGVESRPGVGSDFWFTARFDAAPDTAMAEGGDDAPAAAGDAAGTGAPGAPPGDVGGPNRLAGLHVLLAEDNELNQLVATLMLEHAGATVTVAATGREVTRLLSAPAHYDAVLMDVQMPDMDGLEVTRWIRAQPGLEHLPVIAMTANAREQDRRSCMEAGMNDFLTKPVEPARLYDVVARWRPRVQRA